MMTDNDKKWIMAKKEEAMKNVDYISDPAVKVKAIKDVIEMMIAISSENIIEPELVKKAPVSEPVQTPPQNMGSEDKVRSSDNMKRQAPAKQEEAAPAQAQPVQEQATQPQESQPLPNEWTDELRKQAQPYYEWLDSFVAQPGALEWTNNQLSMFTSGLYQDYKNPEMPPQTLFAFFNALQSIINQAQQQQGA